MCGINGILNADFRNGKMVMALQKMYNATAHRGTKDVVKQHSIDSRISFNWLPITDHPRTLPNEHNGTIVYLNGYISNYLELCVKYGIELKTKSDIEFLAKFLDMHNGNKLDELNGFFAVLYWSPFYNDWLRFTDRYGAKQLYEYTHEGVTYISSEIKGILAALDHKPEVDKKVLQEWIDTLGVVSGDDTIYKGINRVPKLPFIMPEKIDISYEDAKSQLEILLNKAISRNIPNNMPFGVYLSGGIDSGVIAKKCTMFDGLRTLLFSVDYTDSDYSEIELIKKNSRGYHYSVIENRWLKVKYSEIARDFLCDPKAGSCYTNFAVAELASKFVKVMLSGAGGDEFFGGYPHRNDKVDMNLFIYRTSFSCELPFSGYHSQYHEKQNARFQYDLDYLSAILTVEDRASAAYTMETRYPFLDNDLVNFALSLPDEYLENKRILKDVCGLHEDVVNGRKRGFSNPGTNDEWVTFIAEKYE